MPQKSGQKFIRRNRAPRVQIEYELENYGSPEKVQLPFVMGVMADLAGKSNNLLPPLATREFLEIDIDNFNDRMKALKPRVTFTVPNELSGEGNLPIDITLESMADLSPDAIANKIEPLRKLLKARQLLSQLTIFMDGRDRAEKLVNEINAMLADKKADPESGVTPPETGT